MTAALRRPPDRCEAGHLHAEAPRPERPAAAYLVYPMPCEQRTCEGRLICLGHAVCPACAAAIRADRTCWGSGASVEVALIQGARP